MNSVSEGEKTNAMRKGPLKKNLTRNDEAKRRLRLQKQVENQRKDSHDQSNDRETPKRRLRNTF